VSAHPTTFTERRIVVIGTSGSGKTTLARALAKKLGVKHVELDELHWLPNWKEVGDEIMRERVIEALSGDHGWTVDGNYKQVRDLVWSKAEMLIWLDYSFAVVFGRALRRTLRRIIMREKLWHGNRENWRMTFFSKDSILLWVIQTHSKRAREYPVLLARPECAHLRIVRFKHPREADRWLRNVSAASADGSDTKA
jgi:adenylate kinase family enzyme